jgi:hypothetical protein
MHETIEAAARTGHISVPWLLMGDDVIPDIFLLPFEGNGHVFSLENER